MLSIYETTSELGRFKGPKYLYNCEPVTNRFMGFGDKPSWKKVLKTLEPQEWLCHAHPDPALRVPHITHLSPIVPIVAGSRIAKAVAVVSHAGGHLRRHRPALEERNRFATHAQVDLYGRASGWIIARRTWKSTALLPPNYKGPMEGNCGTIEKWRGLARYHAACCFENTQEPYYFTEKYVDAVAVGCAPVYRAHPTVRDTVLQGAAWIDPADHGESVEATLQAALSADRDRIAKQSEVWLRSAPVVRTRLQSVYLQIAGILWSRAEQRS